VQNVGAYGQEVAETITRVRALDRSSGRFVELDRGACRFTYRTSIFNTSARDRYLVTAVRYALRPGAAATTRYVELQRKLAETGRPATLAAVRETVREIRRGKAMLLEAGEPECRSAGSFFKNPIVSEGEYAEVARRAGAEPPRFPAAAGQVKLPAAWLIERAGFTKGYRPRRSDGSISPVGISSRHALAIVNHGGGRSADVLALKREIQQRVFDRFGVRLHPEPVFVGFEPQEL
jgi:UDP-N-acetylmuramate dehydrogenase